MCYIRGGTEVIKVIRHKSMTCVIANTILFNTYTYSMKNYYFCCGFPLAWATRYNNAYAQWSTSGLPHLLKEVGGVERSSQRQKVVRRCAELLEVLQHLPDQPDHLCRPCTCESGCIQTITCQCPFLEGIKESDALCYKFRRPTIGHNCSAVCTNKCGHRDAFSNE